MADGTVQLAPDSTGKRVDTSEQVNALGQVVERQRVALGDGALNGSLAAVDSNNALRVRAPNLEEQFQPAALDLNDPTGDRSLYDLLDATNPNFVPLGTAPAGIDSPGQRPASGSFPVVLANEQTLNKVVSAVWPPGTNSGINVASPTGVAIDVSAYRVAYVQVSALAGFSTATLNFELSNDGASWIPALSAQVTSGAQWQTSAYSISAGSLNLFEVPIKAAYFRARFTAATIGASVTITTCLSLAPPTNQVSPPSTQGVNLTQISSFVPVIGGVGGLLAVAGNIAAGSTPTGYPLQIAGVDSSGKLRVPRVDTSGNLSVTPDPRVTGVQVNPLLVVQPDQPDGVRELLNLILMELRALNANMQSINTPFMDDANGVAYDPTQFNQ